MKTSKYPGATPRQADFLACLERLTRATGLPPTLREAAAELGVHWTRCADMARRLIAAGLLTHRPRCSRSWRVVRRPASSG